jgi:hypothetical protein
MLKLGAFNESRWRKNVTSSAWPDTPHCEISLPGCDLIHAAYDSTYLEKSSAKNSTPSTRDIKPAILEDFPNPSPPDPRWNIAYRACLATDNFVNKKKGPYYMSFAH